MSGIEAAFAQNGPMKSKNIHVGNVTVYNDLTVEDKATFEDDVDVQGTLYAKNGIKIGKTTVTESDFTKTRNGVKGVMDKWVEPPKIKKMRVDDSGKLVNDEDDDNTLLADTVKVPNQIVTRTGVLVGNIDPKNAGDDDTYALPDRVNTRNLFVDNIHERSENGGVTVHNEIVFEKPIRASSKTEHVEVEGHMRVTGSMDNTTLQSAVIGDSVAANEHLLIMVIYWFVEQLRSKVMLFLTMMERKL